MSPAADRSRAPAPAGPSRRVEFPAYRRQRLASGPELFVTRQPGVPLVHATLIFAAGGERNPSSMPGLSAATAALLDEGTHRRSGQQLSSELEGLGATLSTAADWDVAELEIAALSRDLELVLERLAEVASQPSFPEDEIERLRERWLAELYRRRDQPARVADEAIADVVYQGTPYAHPLRGTETGLRALDRQAIARFHATHFVPSGAALVVAGDVDEQRTVAAAERLFAGWTGPVAPAPATVRPSPATRRRIVVVDLPDATQTELRLAQPGVPRTHRDRTRLGVLNALIGGKFTSRLNLNLRERHGFTYGVSSRFVNRRGPGPFVISTAIASDVAGAALGEILGELERIRSVPAGDDEIAETRDYLIGVFPYTLQTAAGLSARLVDLATHGLPDGHFERALAEIVATDADQLQALACRHLDPQLMTVVAAGPQAALLPQLEAYGAVEFRSADGPGAD